MDGSDGGRVSTLRWAWEWTKVLATASLVFLLVRTFLVEAFQIPTASMENTLLVGDFLLVNKAVYGAEVPGTGWRLPALEEPAVGDVVVFEPPPASEQPRNVRYVKRIVAGPGDTIAMRDGALLRNGRAVQEPYAKHVRAGADPASDRFRWQRARLVEDRAAGARYHPTRDNWGPLAVPADSFFVMGDNRDNSEDSRYWGFVARGAIEGRPMVIYYSYDRGERAVAPWLSGVRWDRLFEPVP